MGDRVLFQVVSKRKFSPVVYAHNDGHKALDVVARLRERMADRDDDVDYAAARLVQELTGDDKYNTGYGIWNADARLTKDDTHGDAGVILIHADDNCRAEILCGYHLTRSGT